MEPSEGATILLVEDEPLMLEILGEQLESLGHRVLRAGNGARALQVAETLEGAIDLLVSDLIMPRLDGIELSRELRGRFPGMKTLVMSGLSEGELEQRVGDEALFLCKPFSRGDFAGKVAAALAGT